MNTPNIRPLAVRDVAGYLALRREMLADAPWAFSASADSDKGLDARFLRSLLRHPARQNAIVGGFLDGRLVASAGILREQTPKRRHLALIWGVYVTPSARGRGLGAAVVAAAVELARAWSAPRDPIAAVQLAVSERSRAAQRLYRSLGFRPWGREPDAIRIAGRSFREIHMALPLRPRRRG